MPKTWELRSTRPLPIGARGVASAGGEWTLRWTGCVVMGVVNVTPDSFSDSGVYATTELAVAHGVRLASEGALIVDVGGESTRPGSTGVDLDVELERVIPVVERLAAAGSVVISIDTRKPEVAARAVAAGASIVNDVGGLRDPQMLEVCATLGVPVVIMHMQGTPVDMQSDPHYVDVVSEVTEWLEAHAAAAVAAGVPTVMVDPGIGFGKTFAHNVALLRALPLTARYPVVVGASRKRTVQMLAGLGPDDDRDAATIAVDLFAAQRGVAMVRAHDVSGHVAALAADRALRDD